MAGEVEDVCTLHSGTYSMLRWNAQDIRLDILVHVAEQLLLSYAEFERIPEASLNEFVPPSKVEWHLQDSTNCTSSRYNEQEVRRENDKPGEVERGNRFMQLCISHFRQAR